MVWNLLNQRKKDRNSTSHMLLYTFPDEAEWLEAEMIDNHQAVKKPEATGILDCRWQILVRGSGMQAHPSGRICYRRGLTSVRASLWEVGRGSLDPGFSAACMHHL